MKPTTTALLADDGTLSGDTQWWGTQFGVDRWRIRRGAAQPEYRRVEDHDDWDMNSYLDTLLCMHLRDVIEMEAQRKR